MSAAALHRLRRGTPAADSPAASPGTPDAPAGGRVVCIMGPTASGKSELAEDVALALGGEVVSADSMQVYRGMDIGTAKLAPGSRRVPHHCIDVAEVGEAYSAALFQRDARAAFADIWGRGGTPVLCGGTWLYIRAALEEMHFAAEGQSDAAAHGRWADFACREGGRAAYDELCRLDPASANLIHPNNTRRVVRALEMHEAGESYAERKRRFREVRPWCESVKIALFVERDVLCARIDERVDAMFACGLADEVAGLVEGGLRDAITASQAIGYKEVLSALDGECTLDEAADAVKRATRRFAKRQMSWLRSDEQLTWLDATDGVDDALVSRALELIG